MSRGGEASDGASPPKMHEGEVHDGTLPWPVYFMVPHSRCPKKLSR